LHFGDGSPVFARDPRNYKAASFGFCAQRGRSQAELRGYDAETLRRVIIYDDARKRRVHGAA
jgi:hypothetical protein